MRDANSTSDLGERLKPAIMTLRIIVLALPAGVLGFVVAAVFIRMQQAPAPANEATRLLTGLAIAAAPVALLLSRFLPGLFVAKARAQIASGQFGLPAGPNPSQVKGLQSNLAHLGDDGKLFAAYQTKTILAAALLEGAAFFNVVAFLLGGSPIALGLGLLLALAIVAMFPRVPRVVQWIEDQRRLMVEEKLLGR